MPIHRNDPCPCGSKLAHKFCCRNKPSEKPGVQNLAARVQQANDRCVPRWLRRLACRAIAKRLVGVSAKQVFQPHGAAGCIYGDSTKAQIAHFKADAARRR